MGFRASPGFTSPNAWQPTGQPSSGHNPARPSSPHRTGLAGQAHLLAAGLLVRIPFCHTSWPSSLRTCDFRPIYSDILVDPVRYRLPASVRTAARWLVALAPQPDFCILLDAPSEILQRRKGEVSPAESHRQRLAYAAMFRSIPGGLIVNTDCPVNQAARQVGAAVLARLASTKREQPNSLLIANS